MVKRHPQNALSLCMLILAGLGACNPAETILPTPDATNEPTTTPDKPWIEFTPRSIDAEYNGNHRPGFVATPLFDLDGDGKTDVIAGGGYALNIYLAPNNAGASSWTRVVAFDGAADSTGPSANGGVLFDVNRDGQPDVITGWENPNQTFNLVWLESPADGLNGAWAKHVIDPEDLSFVHDVVLGDVDNDGADDEVVINTENRDFFNGIKWYDIPREGFSQPWPSVRVFVDGRRDDAGLAVADLDRDGRNDIVYNRYVLWAPPDPRTENWSATIYDRGETATSNVVVADLSGDERLDIVVAEGHSFTTSQGLGDIEWWQAPADPATQAWTRHAVSARGLDNPENLATADLDGDGDLDLVTGELAIRDGWNDANANLLIFENIDAMADRWTEHVIAKQRGTTHKLILVDLDGDQKLDIVSEGAGENHIDWFQNRRSGE